MSAKLNDTIIVDSFVWVTSDFILGGMDRRSQQRKYRIRYDYRCFSDKTPQPLRNTYYSRAKGNNFSLTSAFCNNLIGKLSIKIRLNT